MTPAELDNYQPSDETVLAVMGDLKMKRKERFTAGPWHASVGETATVRDEAGQLAGCTHIKTVAGGRRDSDEVAANCRLMAAAPDLYEALEALVESYDDDTWTHNFALPRSWDAAVAALKKARGEQP